MTSELMNGNLKIELSGRVDSNNSQEVEKELFEICRSYENIPVVLDAAGLNYISSAGLRTILRLKKSVGDLSIINVIPAVYEVFDMTGFTEMLTVEKAYRVVSVEGCEEIGRGANGTIYRIDQDNVVKVYNNKDALSEIQHEREVAKLALVLGIPTAISYDVVRVGESYGSVFELLNARPFSKILADEPEKMDWCVRESVEMLKKIHSTLVPAGKLPDMRKTAISWAEFVKDHLPEAEGKKLLELFKAVPEDAHMLHGDFHSKNLELQDDEVLIIDMDTLCVGHPIFEFGSIYNAYQGFSEYDHDTVRSFQGFDFETASKFWKKTLSAYLGTENETKIREVEDKARIVGYTRLIRRAIRRHEDETEKGRAELSLWKSELIELLGRVDSLMFESNEIEVEAEVENLPIVQDFIERHLDDLKCTASAKLQISIASEEIFVNIAHYAYAPEKGKATVRVEMKNDPVSVIITFLDSGIPYDPLKKADPDVSLPASEREIGGLGIFMTKKSMDDVTYEYKNGRNILRLKKNL